MILKEGVGIEMKRFMMRMKRTILYCIVLHVIEWGIFLLSDLYEEKTSTHDVSAWASLLLPIASVIALFLLRRHLYAESGFQKKWHYTYGLAGIWFVLTGLAFIAELCLLDMDKFPVEQTHGGWAWLLNGIEYGVFPALNGIVGGGVLLFSVPAGFLYRKFRENRAAERSNEA